MHENICGTTLMEETTWKT